VEFTKRLIVDFLNKLIGLDKNIRLVIDTSFDIIKKHDDSEKSEGIKVRSNVELKAKNHSSKVKSTISDSQRQMEDAFSCSISKEDNTFVRLQRCKELLALVASAEKSISDKTAYLSNSKKAVENMDITIEDILQGKFDYIWNAYSVNEALKKSKGKTLSAVCESFYSNCKVAEKLLNQEIDTLCSIINQNREALRTKYGIIGEDVRGKLVSEWSLINEDLTNISHSFTLQRNRSQEEGRKVYSTSCGMAKQQLEKLADGFCKLFPPQELLNEYSRIYSVEPSYEKYECSYEMPQNMHIGTLEYNLSFLGLSEYTRSVLDRYYYFLYRENKLRIPYCISFGLEFNYLFKFKGDGRSAVVKNACDFGMRLFMMLPPGKIKFTFIDPVSLGESFAIFTRLVNVDDRTSEVINGKIWSAPGDIESKLRVMTDHISNVTQRCLQGKYDSIFEYNKVAEQNAEAYQIIMLMDFPAGLSEQSLRFLEQISTSGPKCGVFTIIYRNESQYRKISERLYPLISNTEMNFQVFNYSDDARTITCIDEVIKGQQLLWRGMSMPSSEKMDKIIDVLRKGIKSANKVVIGIEKINEKDSQEEEAKEESVNSTREGIRIPIGLHGAKEIQYLTLGVGGSHHALIAGVAGSGKSSLLHTIILQALSQYDPDELRIYLVDFKRGVEFKIYADYKLPSFEVVAIESEREFGYNILKTLEREQKIRADKFKRIKDRKIDRIEDYRLLGSEYKMPRILVIMDEFHELFSNASDKIGKESSEMMERIVRQGRAFGVHIILASQSYANVGGLDKSVYDQMAVRIVLKCSKADANMLLGDGSSDVDQISINDPGRAIYNSEAGNKVYNSHFRVAYIDPSKHRDILKKVSERTSKLSDNKTRILLSNIEDNRYSIFNQFCEYTPKDCEVPGRLYIGESLNIVNNLNMDLSRSEYANMLMIGSDSDKARSMFAFSMLSLAINYWVSHEKNIPTEPFIYFLNYKPLRDDYFIDAPDMIATKLLTRYVKNIPVSSSSEIKATIQMLYDMVITNQAEKQGIDRYLMVFGYQRAENLKSEEKAAEQQDILSMMSSKPSGVDHSVKEMVEAILINGPQNGIHAVFWQDDFKALDFSDRKLITYFYQKIAFDMEKEDYSQFVSVNDISQLGENTAVYNNRIDDIRNFRPYQTPDREWLENICEQLNR